MKRLRVGLLAAVISAALSFGALAQQAPWSRQGATLSVSVSTSSADAALSPATSPTMWVCNTGTVLAYVGFGDSTYAATTADTPIPGGLCGNLSPQGKTYIAAITASSTTTILATPGGGTLTGAGGGGGGGGSVTQGTTPWVDNVAQVNGVTTLAGAGATGTGSQRVTAAQDTTTIAGSAPGTAGTASANVVTVQGVASMTKLLVTPDSVALPANQSVNVAQFGGVATTTGQVAVSTAPATATNTALVVDLRPDSPGITALGQTTKSLSLPVTVASDQSGSQPPANGVATTPTGFTYGHITTDTTTTLKSSAGVLHTICVNTLAATSTITVDDAASATTPTIAVISGANQGCLTFDVAFTVGLTIVTAVAAPDITVSYR